MLKCGLFELEYVMLCGFKVEYFYPSGSVMVFHVAL